MLFLCSGSVIHGLHGEQDMRKMGGLWKHMPGTAICFLIGTLSISGFPGLSGFFSKDDIIANAWNYNPLMGATLLLTAFLTAFYMFRMFFMTFTGEYRGGSVHPHNSSPAMVWPLGALAIPSVLSGWLGVPLAAVADWFAGKGEAPNPFGAFVYYGAVPHFEAANPGMMLAGTTCAFVGIALAWLVYEKKSVSINSAIANSTNALVSGLYQFSFNKWYFDEAYYWLVDRVIWLYRAVWSVVDMIVVDKFFVEGSAFVTDTAGHLLKYTENGRAQSYALVIFSFVAILTLAVYFCRP
jgi:NADH-quinone oxidoreductase subunit L